jgi:triosephosphate isomerase
MRDSFLIVANQKAYLAPSEAFELLDEVTQAVSHEQVSVLYLPSALALSGYLTHPCAHLYDVGAQQGSEQTGAHTGVLPMEHLADFGADYVLVGHSEQRAAGLSDTQVGSQCLAAIHAGLVPIICIGETAEQRNAGKTQEVLFAQLAAAWAEIPLDVPFRGMIAYEPIWAIGTGTPAEHDDVLATVQDIKHWMMTHQQAIDCSYLYGGSVSKETIKRWAELSALDGVLVGSAATQSESFISLLQTLVR